MVKFTGEVHRCKSPPPPVNVHWSTSPGGLAPPPRTVQPPKPLFIITSWRSFRPAFATGGQGGGEARETPPHEILTHFYCSSKFFSSYTNNKHRPPPVFTPPYFGKCPAPSDPPMGDNWGGGSRPASILPCSIFLCAVGSLMTFSFPKNFAIFDVFWVLFATLPKIGQLCPVGQLAN